MPNFSCGDSIRRDSDQWSQSQDSQQLDTDTSSPSNETLKSSNADRRINNLKVANTLHPSTEESREVNENVKSYVKLSHS
jgi:hypothetical protein